jgi:regulator of RNase E activity RraA
MGFPFFAGNVAVSHSYAHIVSIGEPVEVGGLKVEPGNLIYGDCHGVLAIPLDLAAELSTVAARLRDRERKLVGLCRTSDFSIEKMRRLVNEEI